MIKKIKACLNILFSKRFIVLHIDSKNKFLCSSDGITTNGESIIMVDYYVSYKKNELENTIGFAEIDQQIAEILGQN